MSTRTIVVIENDSNQFDELATELRRLGLKPVLSFNSDIAELILKYDAFVLDIDWNPKSRGQAAHRDRDLGFAGLTTAREIRRKHGENAFIAIWSIYVNQHGIEIADSQPDVVIQKSGSYKEEAMVINVAYLNYRLNLAEQASRRNRDELKDYINRAMTFVVCTALLLGVLGVLPFALVGYYLNNVKFAAAAATLGLIAWAVLIRWLGEQRVIVTDWGLFKRFCKVQREILIALVAAIIVETLLIIFR